MSAPLLVLDLDGTLLDTAPDLLAALNAVLAEEGFAPVDRTTVQYNFGQGARSLVIEGLRRNGVTLDTGRLEALTDRFLVLYGAGVATATAPFPGAVAMLDRLAARGVRFAVCTNKRRQFTGPLLDRLGLSDRFAAVVGGDSLPVRKPHRDHLLGTIALSGAAPEDAVMVGDSDADVLAARAAGVPVVAVTFGYSNQPVEALGADAVIDHFDALDAALVRLSPAFAAALAASGP